MGTSNMVSILRSALPNAVLERGEAGKLNPTSHGTAPRKLTRPHGPGFKRAPRRGSEITGAGGAQALTKPEKTLLFSEL